MHKMLRVASLLLCLLLLCCVMSGCNSRDPLPAWADSEELKEKSELVLEDLHNGDYDALTLQFKEEYRSQILEGQWEEQFGPIFEQLGALETYQKFELYGATTNDGVEYAVVLIDCKYEKGTLQFSLSFDEDSELVGLFAS